MFVQQYLGLQSNRPFFNRKSSFFQGQFAIISAFSIENSKFLGVYIAIRYQLQNVRGRVELFILNTKFINFNSKFINFNTSLDVCIEFINGAEISRKTENIKRKSRKH